MAKIFIYESRIYYSETDAIQVVYHGNYLALFERARTEMLREIGIELPALAMEKGIYFAARALQMQFFSPLRLDDAFCIESKITHVGRASLECHQVIKQLEAQALQSTELSITLVTVGRDFKPCALPKDLSGELANVQ